MEISQQSAAKGERNTLLFFVVFDEPKAPKHDNRFSFYDSHTEPPIKTKMNQGGPTKHTKTPSHLITHDLGYPPNNQPPYLNNGSNNNNKTTNNKLTTTNDLYFSTTIVN